jgi:hypothetical protein
MRSGLNVPTPTIPMPDLAVPYAAPAPKFHCQPVLGTKIDAFAHIRISLRMQRQPVEAISNDAADESSTLLTIPKKGANFGDCTESSMMKPARGIGDRAKRRVAGCQRRSRNLRTTGPPKTKRRYLLELQPLDSPCFALVPRFATIT